MNKKSIILCLAMTILPLLAGAHDFEVNGIYYNITSSTTAEVTSSDGTEYSSSITIPATVTHNGVEYSVTSIGERAFYYCSSLTDIIIPEGVTSIGDEAFNYCSSLTDIIIPEGVTSIGDYAFCSCSSLTTIILLEGVTSIGGQAFRNCSSLTAINIPASVMSIGDYAFLDCNSLESITIPEGVTSIGDYAFLRCSSLTAITIPENSQLTSIGERAFSDCSSLKSITIPKSVTSIGDEAFNYCSSLTAIVVAEGNKVYDSRGGCNAIIETSSNTLIRGCSTTIIPEGVTSIGDKAFSSCSSLTAITIPEGVTSIEYCAFEGCSSLTAITIPESVTSIGWYAFYGCSSLAAITIPESVTSIEGSTFSGCSSLKELTLGKGLKKIAAGAFNSCTALEKVTIYATRPPSIEGTGNAFFSDATYENATLYVPQGCIDKYQVMTGWSNFYTIEEMEGGTPNYLTLRQADNGEVGIVVEPGRTYKVRITAFEGWKIHSVTFNDTDVTTQLTEEGIYTTPALQADAVLNIAYEKIEDDAMVENARASRIKVQGHRGTLRITGTTEGDDISVYTTDGAMVAHQQGEADENLFTVETNKVYIVKIADKVVKIGM